MNPTIILIGPLGAGKSTLGRLLADRLAVPFCSVDDVRAEYHRLAGYDEAFAAQLAASEGVWAVLRYSKPFEAQLVARILTEHHGVIDFGASNSVYDDEVLLAQVEKTLAPYLNVILLLPSPNPEESVAILKDRLVRKLSDAGKDYSDELFELNDYFVKHPSNRKLATRVIYTKGKTPDMVCDELEGTLA